jgi:uncharacterized protein YnzC (UPF0291/DUF896 family)
MAMLCAPALAQDGTPPKPGQTVDIKGNQAIDPTKNVLDLVLAAVKRIDDILDLTVKRQDDLRLAQAALEDLRYSSIKENSALRADYEDKLRKAEANRLDAIRIVDTNNVSVASERANATAAALAKKGDDAALVLSAQVTKSADDVRTLVKNTADEQARNLQQQFAGIQNQFNGIGTRLTALEQTGAEGAGRQKFQDPALAALISEVQKLSRVQSDNSSVGSGRSDVIGWIVAALMLMIAIGTLAVQAVRSRPLTGR